MNISEYYKYVSEKAFLIKNYKVETNDCGKSAVIVKINFDNDDVDYEKFLKDNNVFKFKIDEDKLGDGDKRLNVFNDIVVRFYDKFEYVTSFLVYSINTIDCSIYSDMNEILLFIHPDDIHILEISEELESNLEYFDTDDKKDEDSTTKTSYAPSLLDGMFGLKFPEFPKFDDFFADMNKKFDDLKKAGSKFCEVSYQMDSKGNGHYRKVDNDGVVEKHFKRVGDEVKEITDDTNKKTELKDLLK